MSGSRKNNGTIPDEIEEDLKKCNFNNYWSCEGISGSAKRSLIAGDYLLFSAIYVFFDLFFKPLIVSLIILLTIVLLIVTVIVWKFSIPFHKLIVPFIVILLTITGLYIGIKEVEEERITYRPIFYKRQKRSKFLLILKPFYLVILGGVVFIIYEIVGQKNITFALTNGSLPAIIMNFSMILVALIIPIGIANFNKLVQDKSEPFAFLDLQVFVSYYINPWIFLLFLVAIFAPLPFLRNSVCDSNVVNLIMLFFISLWGIYGITRALLRLYDWNFENRSIYRMAYFYNAGFDKNFIKAFHSVWIAKDLDRDEEKEYLYLFFKRIIGSIACQERLNITKALLADFRDNLKNRNPENMDLIKDVLEKIADKMVINPKNERKETILDVAKRKSCNASIVFILFRYRQVNLKKYIEHILDMISKYINSYTLKSNSEKARLR